MSTTMSDRVSPSMSAILMSETRAIGVVPAMGTVRKVMFPFASRRCRWICTG